MDENEKVYYDEQAKVLRLEYQVRI